jgi:hypothetical protein
MDAVEFSKCRYRSGFQEAYILNVTFVYKPIIFSMKQSEFERLEGKGGVGEA